MQIKMAEALPQGESTTFHKRKYVETLKNMFPDIDLDYLEALCDTANGKPWWLDDTITELLKGNYIREISAERLPNPEVIDPEDEEVMKIITEKNYSKFREFLPNADPRLWRAEALPQVESTTDDHKRKYVETLKDMFPDIDLAYLEALCDTANENPRWLDDTITELLKGNYARQISVDRLPSPEVIDPEDEEVMKIINEINYSTFSEFLPNADPRLWRAEGLLQVESTTDDHKRKYVKTLKDMFPDIDLAYLEALCDTSNENPQWLDDTITELLKGNYARQISVDRLPNPEVIDPEDEEPIEIIIEKNYSKFREFVPNADPRLLRDAAELCGNNEDLVEAMITVYFEKGNYPTLKDYIKDQKNIDSKRKYVDNFNVEEFLEIFPEPIKYFCDKRRHNEDCRYDLTYLKARYRRIKGVTLKEYYHKYGNNLTRACIALDKCQKNRKTLRKDQEITYPETWNISFIQEVAFIENKYLIKSFLKEKQRKRQAAYNEAKEKGELLTCSCCFDEEILRGDIVPCDEGHLFCKQCVQKYVETEFGMGKTSFPCLTTCDMEFSLTTLQGVLKASVFSRLLQKKQAEEVNAAGIPGLENCPFCDFAMIPPPEDKVFRCLNTECMKHSCRKCKNEDHIPLRCEEVEKPGEIKVRKFIEDKMTEALVRICWKCKRKFVKEEGCNKMACICGAIMCYLCRQPVTDYKHFNGQGGTDYEKCPLFSKNDEIHVQAVLEEGRRAKAQALLKNPDVKLKHDPTKEHQESTLQRTDQTRRHNDG